MCRCVDVDVWMSMCGCRCVDVDVWMSMCGCRCVDVDVRMSMCGCRCVDVDVWMSSCGCRRVDVDVWMSMCGCRCVDVDVWMSMCECRCVDVDVSMDGWMDPSLMPRVARFVCAECGASLSWRMGRAPNLPRPGCSCTLSGGPGAWFVVPSCVCYPRSPKPICMAPTIQSNNST
jgi:hypothetical protein